MRRLHQFKQPPRFLFLSQINHVPFFFSSCIAVTVSCAYYFTCHRCSSTALIPICLFKQRRTLSSLFLHRYSSHPPFSRTLRNLKWHIYHTTTESSMTNSIEILFLKTSAQEVAHSKGIPYISDTTHFLPQRMELTQHVFTADFITVLSPNLLNVIHGYLEHFIIQN